LPFIKVLKPLEATSEVRICDGGTIFFLDNNTNSLRYSLSWDDYDTKDSVLIPGSWTKFACSQTAMAGIVKKPTITPLGESTPIVIYHIIRIRRALNPTTKEYYYNTGMAYIPMNGRSTENRLIVQNNRLFFEVYEFEDEESVKTKPAPHILYSVIVCEIKEVLVVTLMSYFHPDKKMLGFPEYLNPVKN
jgi:hypothetical protein